MNGDVVKENGYNTGNLVAILCYKNVQTPTEMSSVLLGGGGGSSQENSIIYTAQLYASEWQDNGVQGYTQTVPCLDITQTTVCFPPYTTPTGNKDTDIAIREALGYIDVVDTDDGQITVTCYTNKPAMDFIINLVPATGNTQPVAGTGTVRSVNGIQPDGLGNVSIIADMP